MDHNAFRINIGNSVLPILRTGVGSTGRRKQAMNDKTSDKRYRITLTENQLALYVSLMWRE